MVALLSHTWFGPAAVLLAGTVGYGGPSAGNLPIRIGPHKTPIRWISFAEAHGERRFGVPPEDRPDVTAGYLLVRGSRNVRDDIVMFEGQFAHTVPEFDRAGGVWVMPVTYAPQSGHRRTVLVLARERVKVDLPYSPGSLPARYPPIVFKAGPCKFEGYGYQCIEPDRVHVYGLFAVPPCTDWVWDEHVGKDDGKHYGGTPNREFSYLDGKMSPAGDLVFTGEVRFWTSRKADYDPKESEYGYKHAHPYSYRVVFHPQPVSGTAPAGTQRQLGRRVLEPFDYKGVNLLNGPLKRQFDQARDDYLRIPNDDLLKGFRLRAGLPAPGVDLGGWYTDDVFHVFGQIIAGLARMSAATGDPACKAKADALLAAWAACIAPDGYFYYSKTPNAQHYIYDKMVGGLVDMAVYRHSKLALACLSKITDWAIKNLGRERRYANLSNGTEWYTLSENLYRAYLLTGDTKYRDFAKVWEYTDYWDLYAQKQSIFTKKGAGYHAYSHVNTLSGAGAAYLATGESHYLATLVNAYDFLQNTQCFATGGYGPNESLLPRGELLKALATTHATFETQCGTWAGFKMSKYLMSFTGDARYGDWVERLLLNGIGASIPMSADGKVFYYADYNTEEGVKVDNWTQWTCCTGTRPEAVADFHDLIYFKGRHGIYVNLYTPSSVVWNGVTVHQRTRFPESPVSDFTVTSSKPAIFAMAFRVPGWLARPMRVLVNGRPVETVQDNRHWLAVSRSWRNGDRVHVELPMGFWTHHIALGTGYPAALMYGPVTMAIRFQNRYPLDAVNLSHPGAGLSPVPGQSLNFHLAGRPGVLVRPFYEFKEGEPYVMYVDPSVSHHVPQRAMRFTGRWQHGNLHYTNEVGSTVEADFQGTGVRWLGYKFDDAAIVEVTIDGKHVADVDQFGPGRELPFNWEIRGLPAGRHRIRLTLTPAKNPASKDHFVNLEALEILEAGK